MARIRTWNIACLVFLLLLAGCRHDESRNLDADISRQEKTAELSSVTAGAGPVVEGSSASFRLPLIDFNDDKNGVMVKQSDKELRLLSTSDGGQTWSEEPIPGQEAVSLQMLQPDSIWIMVKTDCEAEGRFTCGREQLLHTMDRGRTWSPLWQQSLPEDTWTESGIQFTSGQNGYILSGRKLFFTQNGGKEWQEVQFDLAGFKPEHMSFVDTATGWVAGTLQEEAASSSNGPAASGKAVVLSTGDQGKTWKRQITLSEGQSPLYTIGIRFIATMRGWLLSGNPDTLTGSLYQTADGGNRWKKINEIQSARPAPADLQFVGQTGWIPLDQGAGPIEGGILITQDGGQSFKQAGVHKGWSIHAADLVSAREGWAVGTLPNRTDYLLHTTDGGRSWSVVYPQERPVQDIAFTDEKNGYAIGGLADPLALLQTSDGGASWHTLYRFDQETTAVHALSFLDKNIGWVVASGAGEGHSEVLLTMDGGKTWEVIAQELQELGSEPDLFFRFFDRQNGLIAVMDAQGLLMLRSRDGGLTWEASSRKPLPRGGPAQAAFVSMTEGWLVIQGKDGEANRIYRMTDGETWQEAGSLPYDDEPYAFTFSNREQGWLLSRKLFPDGRSGWNLLRTNDGGVTWKLHAFNDSAPWMDTGIRMSAVDSDFAWLLNENGLWKTSDGGMKWDLAASTTP